MADEDMQQRETYGGAPGWSQNQKIAGVAPAPAQDAQADSSPADAEAAPSADAAPSDSQPSEQATPPTSQPEQQKQFNMPPPERWSEVIRQKEEAEARARQAEAMARLALERATPHPVQSDPWEGLINHPDPQTAQFYQQQKRLVDHAVMQGRQQAIQELSPVLTKLQEGQAQFTIRDFRKENPDIKPGSEEERMVVAYMNGEMDGVRHPIESARRNVKFDKLEAENRALKGKQATIPQKRAAAQSDSSAGIPATAGLPPRPGDWRQKAGDILDKGGTLKDVLGTVFGGSRST